jgi:glycosyltransferase involved in cell wall biosynthesis
MNPPSSTSSGIGGETGPDQKGKGLRILLLSNLFPPHVKGGAELACAHLAEWLAAHGHTVGVMTLAAPDEVESVKTEAPGLTVFRKRIPNVYHTFNHVTAALWKKPAWHLIDHYQPIGAARLREVLAEFRPQVVNTHNIQGMGYNLWGVLAKAGVPVLVTLHDLGLLCFRQSMFKHGQNCGTQCLVCKASAAVRGHYVGLIEKLAFVSPSRALLTALDGALPSHASPGIHLPNPLNFPTRSTTPPTGSVTRLLYVGQVTAHKGVPFLLEALEALSDKGKFQLTVVGKGDCLDPLREKYRDCAWVRFTGFVAPEAVGGYMKEADVLLVPSLWYENQPLVVLQARALALPLMVSDRGGLPELVEDGVFGRVLEAGNRAVWEQALQEITADPPRLDRWKAEALVRQAEFAVDALGRRYVEIVQHLLPSPSRG